MGTDMHGPIVETGTHRPWDNEIHWWPRVLYQWQNRNYLLFEVIAGVRGDGAYNIIPPRGIPEGSYAVERPDDDEDDKGMYWIGDHSFTWLTPKEWEQVVLTYWAALRKEGSSYSTDVPDIAAVDHILKLYEHEEHVRLIFGFDS